MLSSRFSPVFFGLPVLSATLEGRDAVRPKRSGTILQNYYFFLNLQRNGRKSFSFNELRGVCPAVFWALWRLRRTTPPLPTQNTQVCDRGDPWFISGRPGYFGWSDPGLIFAYDSPRKGKRENLSPADPPSKRLRPISKLFLRWV